MYIYRKTTKQIRKKRSNKQKREEEKKKDKRRAGLEPGSVNAFPGNESMKEHA